jgi:UDP-glucose-4-epimerase GalE
MTKTVIVTGGCGYIGSHVARAFKQAGFTVYIVDTVFREHTVKDIDGYLIGDFASDAVLSMIINYAPDIIVHCAGTSLVGPSMTDPAEYYDNNVTKTIKMMDVVKDMPKKPTIMFSSSASVYGIPKESPIREQAPVSPISPYGSTKMIVEQLLEDYGSAYGINTICFRYFNAAGAIETGDLGQEPNATHLVARTIEASLNKRLLTINGEDFNTLDGTCVRDYVHVWDIALAHTKAAEFFAIHYGQDTIAGHHVFNLGGGRGTSNKEIVDCVYYTYGLTTVKYGPARPGDPDILVADISTARTVLGWKPVNSDIKNIIDTAYNWYNNRV